MQPFSEMLSYQHPTISEDDTAVPLGTTTHDEERVPTISAGLLRLYNLTYSIYSMYEPVWVENFWESKCSNIIIYGRIVLLNIHNGSHLTLKIKLKLLNIDLIYENPEIQKVKIENPEIWEILTAFGVRTYTYRSFRNLFTNHYVRLPSGLLQLNDVLHGILGVLVT